MMLESYRRQVAEARAYAETLAPGSYEQEWVKLSIAMWECWIPVLESMTPVARVVLELVVRVAQWWVSLRVVSRELISAARMVNEDVRAYRVFIRAMRKAKKEKRT
jgi:hypothetical protein